MKSVKVSGERVLKAYCHRSRMGLSACVSMYGYGRWLVELSGSGICGYGSRELFESFPPPRSG